MHFLKQKRPAEYKTIRNFNPGFMNICTKRYKLPFREQSMNTNLYKPEILIMDWRACPFRM